MELKPRIYVAAVLAAFFPRAAPAHRASRIDPMTALRQD
jgi:ABC-type lipoprotein release transport system permease subunit